MASLSVSSGLRVVLIDILECEAGIAERNAARHREALKSFSEDPDGITFQVQLISLWANEGEKEVLARSRVSIKRAIQQAQARFKTVNKRGDVQAKYVVHVLVGRKPHPFNHPVPVPEEFYRHFQ